MDVSQLDEWVSSERQNTLVAQLIRRVGVTRVRAECFVRLWIYLLVKQRQLEQPPLNLLTVPDDSVICTHREAADLFYHDKEQGSDRAAGLMLDKLAALGLISKFFDGNTTRIQIHPALEFLEETTSPVALTIDAFDLRCDAIPVANLLVTNYNWMNRNLEATPHRITRILREWAARYSRGIRVLRRTDNLNPVGCYLLYPTAHQSEVNFFNAPSKALHLTGIRDEDPFVMATPGDLTCTALFIRSWIIDPMYLETYRVPFIQDAQQTLKGLLEDFPNLCDLYTLIIHPSYEALATALGFQKTGRDAQLPLYWMYLPLDRFLALDVTEALLRIAN